MFFASRVSNLLVNTTAVPAWGSVPAAYVSATAKMGGSTLTSAQVYIIWALPYVLFTNSTLHFALINA